VQEKIGSGYAGIIDYASEGKRNDFMDIYLLSKCRFMVCSETGIVAVPLAFKRPLVLVNYTSLKYIHTYFANSVIITKKFYSRHKKRNLRFSEIMDSELCEAYHNDLFEKNGVELIENTSQEISDAVIEMDERLKGAWVETDEDERLQEKFWSIIGKDIIKRPETRLGAKFLRENKDLLE
jgi:putative glycosyltransferase (TIGR04372 family)